MKRLATVFLALLLLSNGVPGKQVPQSCGTYRENWKEKLHLHNQALKARKRSAAMAVAAQTPAASRNRDIGNIAVIDDGDGVVSQLNAFNLDAKTLKFQPGSADASRYRFQVSDGSYDAALAAAGALISGLGDDDSRAYSLPFAFPFYGGKYQQVFVNSDGNLTFLAADSASTDRSLGRLAAGPPRIAPLFTDLDPTKSTKGVRVLAEAARFVVSWVEVPIYQDYGVGDPQTFQVRIYPDGRIEFAWGGITTTEAVVGLSPGGLQGSTTVVSFLGGSQDDYASTVAERFTSTSELDIVMAAQTFYQTHDDAYDYLVFFNNMGIPAYLDAVAYEVTVRTERQGIGDVPVDVGQQLGSPRRLQSVMNMGNLSQYPADPYTVVPLRATARDTTMSLLAHESGHLFLAFASVREPYDPDARPMLGRQAAHWAFTFNSEASVMEGNRIQDNGTGVSPRFLTTDTVQQYAPLDQYLMGFRAPAEVPPTFLVENATISPLIGPRPNTAFDGTRRDVMVDEVIQAEGRRVPDDTVSQRSFRLAFVLVTHQGVDPSSQQLSQIEGYRSEFEKYYPKAASDRASVDTTLKSSLRLSVFPAAGVVEGASAPAAISTARRLSAPLSLLLRSRTGAIAIPASVTIPTGSTSVSFDIRGNVPGVDDLIVEPSDTSFETVAARIQVAAPAGLTLALVSGNQQKPVAGQPLPQPIVIRVTDGNNLPYPGVKVKASVTSGGKLPDDAILSDEDGLVRFQWTPGPGPVNQLTATLDGVTGGPAVTAVALGTPGAAAVVNAASFASGISPGSLASVFGSNLAAGVTAQAQPPLPTELGGVMVLLDGNPVPLLYVSDGQINFFVPRDLAEGTTILTVQNLGGTSAPLKAPVVEVQPGIFVDTLSGLGAVRAVGGAVEVYCTGLGPVARSARGLDETLDRVTARIGTSSATVTYSGLAPGATGLYQVNAVVPPGVSGTTTLQLTVAGQPSNEVKIQLF